MPDPVLVLAKSPHDEELRLVVADAILEEGGPRAELVTLETERRTQPFAKKREVRYRELVAEHGAEWAGALDRWFLPENRVFEGGVMVAGTLKSARGVKLDAPGWRLLRDLEVPGDASAKDALALLARPELVSLRGLYGVSWEAARALTAEKKKGGLAPVTSLGLRHIGDPSLPAREDVTLGDGAIFPALARLVIDWRASRGGGDWDAFTRSGVGGHVPELEVLAAGEIVGWLPRLANSKVRTLTMNLGTAGGAWAAEGDWRIAVDLATYRLSARWMDGDDAWRPSARGIDTLLMNWRNDPGKTAALVVDDATLARMAPAERKRMDAIMKHVGITAEVRREEETRRLARLEEDNFRRFNRLYLGPKGRFYFDFRSTLYTGELGKAKSVKTKVVPAFMARKMREQGFERSQNKARVAEALRTIGHDVPGFLLPASPASTD